MSTTSLFVELIVIGAGALLWVALLVAAVFGVGAFPLTALLSPGPLVALVPFVYLLGILTDRAADRALSGWEGRLLSRVYDDKQTYYDDHRDLRTGSTELASMLDYGRSRLRICRGWAFNSLLIAVAWVVFAVSSQRQDAGGSELLVSLVFLLLAAGCTWVWRDLTLTEYKKVQRQSTWVRSSQHT